MDEETKLQAPPFVIVPPKRKPASKNVKGMKPIHPNLPQLPFTTCLVGPRHSGKTVVLFNLLSKEELCYGDAFKPSNVILYSPTHEFDTTLEDLHLKNVYGPPTTLEWIVSHVKTRQKQYMDSNDMSGVLLVLEDITNIRDAWRVMEDLSYTGRHYHIHVLAVAHKLSSIPRGVRTQLQQWLLFKPHEESEREWILYMFSRKRTWDIWENAIHRAWSIEYNFIYIDFERKGIENIYRSGFNDPFFTPEEMAVIESSGPVLRPEEMLQENEQEGLPQLGKSQRPRGRPPVHKVGETIEPKKKRGRPRKHLT